VTSKDRRWKRRRRSRSILSPSPILRCSPSSARSEDRHGVEETDPRAGSERLSRVLIRWEEQIQGDLNRRLPAGVGDGEGIAIKIRAIDFEIEDPTNILSGAVPAPGRASRKPPEGCSG